MEGDTQFPSVDVPAQDELFQVLYRKPKDLPSTIGTGEEDEKQETEKTKERKSKPRQGSYAALGLSSAICKALAQAGYNFPTPIQRKVIPPILDGHDVVAMARTGSGKTAAFLAPLLNQLDANPLLASTASKNNGPRVLVIAPTRELVLQELKFCRLYAKHLKSIRTAVVVGGTPLDAQFAALAVCPDIVFATPGRLLQLLAEMGARGGLTISTTEIVVFDEADRLFEGTLAVETAAIIAQLKDKTTENMSKRQTVLVSATMPHALAEFSRTGLRDNLKVIRLDADRSLSPTLATAFIGTRGDVGKDASLQIALRKMQQDDLSTIVFAATHRRVEYLTALVKHCIGSRVKCIHGNMDQIARQESVKEFRKKKGVLIVTDVAARGIDIPELDVVINYDMPATPKLFVHRVGRAGRAGRFGMAISLVAPDELPYMFDVFLFVGREIKYMDNIENHDNPGSSSQAYKIDSSFVYGSLPKGVVDEEVEFVKSALDNLDIEKAYQSARNAQKLYVKTRGNASGESIRRAKTFVIEDGGRKFVPTHPWFVSLESAEGHAAAKQAELISVWRPVESAVLPPGRIASRKRKRTQDEISSGKGEMGDTNNFTSRAAYESDNFDSEALVCGPDPETNTPTGRKISARQRALEEERKQFFLPTHQQTRIQQTRALKVKTGGSMGDDLRAYKELQEAAMDINADENADLLRAKHTGSNSGKYWDRVTKRFVKGGVNDATSKRNLHVASREARARTNAGNSYGTEDGERFKRWLSKNKKTVEQLSEKVNSGASDGAANFGLGMNDFRRGAFGRKARLRAVAKQSQHTGAATGRPELKSAEQIKKTRKLKDKAEARRQAHLNKKRGKSAARKRGAAPSVRSSSKSRLIVRRKK
ncbi:ATP-dependent RNA helicase DDX54 [Gracilariopsis chorda]|uniref:ATP-dependent RNA helicase DDX54 n=1 Tax=Gracilariopsis chorda TaxID=448386 RepID=A0A2V3J271_9FLOR|nr:ATP-dependent RNA helicase DDX54 [Gracilariopsis chorda]|eukprot:PXF48551.1 ATP-dependent RNA helicase DDX54 [Gracilariopsis chorda]